MKIPKLFLVFFALGLIPLAALAAVSGDADDGARPKGPTARAVENDIEIGNISKVLKSGDTPHVALVTLKNPNGTALLHVIGVDVDWNNKIVLHRVRRIDNRVEYIQTIGGRDYLTLTETSVGGGKVYRLYLPYEKEPVSMTYSEELSRQLNPQTLIRDYLAREKAAKEQNNGPEGPAPAKAP